MKKNSFIKILLLVLMCFCIFPRSVSAASYYAYYTKKWTKSLNLPDVTFYTKGKISKRDTHNLGGFYVQPTKDEKDGWWRVFCVEPGIAFSPETANSGYSESTKCPTGKKYDIAGDVVHLEKVMSCWKENNASVVAAQALVWELVTEERDGINASEILGRIGVSSEYQPYQSDGSVYGDQIGSEKYSIYERIYQNRNNGNGSKVYDEYRAILKCAARFNIATPSWASASESSGKKQELTKYVDATQTSPGTFSRTFYHGSSLASDLFKFYTFKINEKTADCKKGATVDDVKCSCDDEKCTFSTTKEISSSSPVKVEFKYTYKDDGTSKLNTTSTKYYTKSGQQTLMTGSTAKSFYINLYTGTKPNYQLKVKKIDAETKEPISGIKFNIYSDSAAKTKIGTTTATDKNGEATYSGITKIGTYYIKEANTPDGYKTNNTIYSVKVTASNTVAKKSYATVTVTNTSTKLKMTKYTIDEEGNKTKLTGDACQVPVCENEDNRENGPIFTIEKDGKYVCVTETGTDGSYKYNSMAATCPSGTTNKIKTCEGEFAISNMPSGTYTVKEIAAACGTTLPTNPTKTITVKPGNDTAVTMENGVSGVVFHKIDENGNLLAGGSFALQRKENGVYKDVLLTYSKGIVYKYDSNVKSESDGGTYLLDTYSTGMVNVVGLPTGEYRFVEKEAPTGYIIIKDKDSTATFTVSDKSQDEYYNVELINKKEKTTGSYDSAELIVAIITGRRVINYVLLIGGLAVVLVGLIFLRKKLKK